MINLRNSIFILILCFQRVEIRSQPLGQTIYYIATVYTDSTIIVKENIDLQNQLVTQYYVYYSNWAIKERYFSDLDYGINGGYYKYFSNGKVRSVTNYFKGRIGGFYVEFYNNGSIMQKGYYQSNDCTDSIDMEIIELESNNLKYSMKTEAIGIKDLKWSYYSKEGILIRDENWFRGKLLETKKY